VKAMILRKLASLRETRTPLELVDMPVPTPTRNEILIKISACGVCHTELDEIEGRTPPLHFPVIPGHQIVGRVEKPVRNGGRFKSGDRVGVGWIYSACGDCKFCRDGHENLCRDFRATGRDVDGGYAEYCVVPEDFAYPIPEVFSDALAAPLLCAGAIGFRSLRLTELIDGGSIGLSGFGASAHLVIAVIRHQYPKSKIFVFSRSDSERQFALSLGASWVGNYDEESPEKLQAVIDTTPVWMPVVKAMRNLEPGGRLVINAIRKEAADKEILTELDYEKDLWMEKEIHSVANITRKDIADFLKFAAEIPLKPEVQEFSLEDANAALLELREGKIRGAKVLRCSQ
jgi:propanol-preferring alcohol dehydrogenase